MISVVVCTYNRHEMLARMLEQFFAQDDIGAVEHELIVVDNNSSDGTARVVEGLRQRFSAIRYVRESTQGIAPARNRGIREARGEIVAYLDDDVLVDPGWLTAMARGMQETGADILAGRVHLIFELPPPEWLGPMFRLYLAETEFGPERVVANPMKVWTLNTALRKSTVQSHGCFCEAFGRRGRELLGGEEPELFRRIAASGGSVMYDPAPSGGHYIDAVRLTWQYFKRLGDGTARSTAMLEEPVDRIAQFKRVLRMYPEIWRSRLKAMRAETATGSPYEKAVARFRVIQARGLLRGRRTIFFRGCQIRNEESAASKSAPK